MFLRGGFVILCEFGEVRLKNVLLSSKMGKKSVMIIAKMPGKSVKTPIQIFFLTLKGCNRDYVVSMACVGVVCKMPKECKVKTMQNVRGCGVCIIRNGTTIKYFPSSSRFFGFATAG